MIRVAVVAEDGTGAWLVETVCNRLLPEVVAWVEAESLDHCREWVRPEPEPWWALKNASRLLRARFGDRFRLRVQADGDGALELANMFTYLADTQDSLDLVVVARDEDRRGRSRALAAVRSGRNWPFRIVGAMAEPEAEAWLIATWRPRTAAEQERHAAEVRRLGFDPVQESNRLHSTVTGSDRDTKRVAQALFGEERDHFERAETATWQRVGTNNGLASFVVELREALGAVSGSGPSKR